MQISLKDVYLLIDDTKSIKLCVLNKQKTKVKTLTDNKEYYLLNDGKIQNAEITEHINFIYYKRGIVTQFYKTEINNISTIIFPIILTIEAQEELGWGNFIALLPEKNDEKTKNNLLDSYKGNKFFDYMKDYLYLINEKQVKVLNDYLMNLCGIDEFNFIKDENIYKPLSLQNIYTIEKTMNDVKNNKITKINEQNIEK